MTVKQLIENLQQFPEDMEVLIDWDDIDIIKQVTWTHSNYPYNKPDKEVVLLQ